MIKFTQRFKRLNDRQICEQENKQCDNECDKTTINTNVQPKTVLLQTAQAVTLHKTGKISTPVRILFDTGSQRSYVTENLQSKLKLKFIQHKRLNLNTFGEAC